MEYYVYSNQKKLRCGYTTGSCATGAATAAARMLLRQEVVKMVDVDTPKGIQLHLDIHEPRVTKESASGAVQKDGGDDSDATHGILIFATARMIDKGVVIDGGFGVGRVTQSGLDQPVGNAAINSVPRQMITNAVTKVMDEEGYHGGMEIIISIPEGEEIAKKTFNPRLGIVGGLSVLGTSGIVEPMSEKALVDTIHTEMSMRSSTGTEYVLVTPGNYGEDYISKNLKGRGDEAVKSSNFIGDTIDMGYEFKFKGMLIVGHIGKLIKIAAGVMNTHSRYADGRREAMVTAALQAGASRELMLRLCDAVTTDQGLAMLEEENLLEPTMQIIMERIEYHLERRACDGMTIGAITFSNKFGFLGQTSKADWLIEQITKEKVENK